MSGTVEDMDDYVVDVVIEVDSRGIGVEEIARRLCQPGMEILRVTERGTIWLTALVAARGESAAIREVRDGVVAQLPDRPRSLAAAVVGGDPLGDLHSRLHSILADADFEVFDAHELVDRHSWERQPVGPGIINLRPVDVRAQGAWTQA